jgi:hypothetical protein
VRWCLSSITTSLGLLHLCVCTDSSRTPPPPPDHGKGSFERKAGGGGGGGGGKGATGAGSKQPQQGGGGGAGAGAAPYPTRRQRQQVEAAEEEKEQLPPMGYEPVRGGRRKKGRGGMAAMDALVPPPYPQYPPQPDLYAFQQPPPQLPQGKASTALATAQAIVNSTTPHPKKGEIHQVRLSGLVVSPSVRRLVATTPPLTSPSIFLSLCACKQNSSCRRTSRAGSRPRTSRRSSPSSCCEYSPSLDSIGPNSSRNHSRVATAAAAAIEEAGGGCLGDWGPAAAWIWGLNLETHALSHPVINTNQQPRKAKHDDSSMPHSRLFGVWGVGVGWVVSPHPHSRTDGVSSSCSQIACGHTPQPFAFCAPPPLKTIDRHHLRLGGFSIDRSVLWTAARPLAVVGLGYLEDVLLLLPGRLSSWASRTEEEDKKQHRTTPRPLGPQNTPLHESSANFAVHSHSH